MKFRVASFRVRITLAVLISGVGLAVGILGTGENTSWAAPNQKANLQTVPTRPPEPEPTLAATPSPPQDNDDDDDNGGGGSAPAAPAPAATDTPIPRPQPTATETVEPVQAQPGEATDNREQTGAGPEVPTELEAPSVPADGADALGRPPNSDLEVPVKEVRVEPEATMEQVAVNDGAAATNEQPAPTIMQPDIDQPGQNSFAPEPAAQSLFDRALGGAGWMCALCLGALFIFGGLLLVKRA